MDCGKCLNTDEMIADILQADPQVALNILAPRDLATRQRLGMLTRDRATLWLCLSVQVVDGGRYALFTSSAIPGQMIPC